MSETRTKGPKQADGKNGDHSPIIPPYDDGSPRTHDVAKDGLRVRPGGLSSFHGKETR
jgi:hypothetical protein